MQSETRGRNAARVSCRWTGRLAVVALVLLAAACAERTVAPAVPAVARFPDFVYPAVPPELQQTEDAARVDTGWRFLQNGDTRNAAREFAAALRRNARLYPARVGEAYVHLARGERDQALSAFTDAVQAAPQYVPALVGRGQTLLSMNRDADALAAFEAALAVDASLAEIRRRVDVLRFRTMEQVIRTARDAAAGERLEQARAAYERAIALSPESAFLYRELAVVERRMAAAESARQHFARAVELDPSDAVSLVAIGDLLVEQGEYAEAEAAYRKAAALDSTPELSQKLAALAERVRELKLSPEFRAIRSRPAITRGDLAALLAERLERVLESVPARQVVITDAAGHWAADRITQVARAGVMEPFENHTFQPELAVRRGDLAAVVSRIVTLAAADDSSLRARIAAQPAIVDMPPTHLSYPAAAVAVASGVMPLLDGGRFEVNRPVTGAEAADVVGRLRALTR